MAHEKITVDEPLISTDVDSLIRTLSEKRRVSLNDLRQMCKIDKKTMEKWLAVLEDEGYINVEYGIRGTFVNWIGLGLTHTSDDVISTVESVIPEPKAPEQTPVETYVSEDIPPTSLEVPEDDTPSQDSTPMDDVGFTNTELSEEANSYHQAESAESEPEPEELLSEYLARKNQKGSIDADSLRTTILTKLDKTESAEKFRPQPKQIEEIAPEVLDEVENETAEEAKEETEVRKPKVRDQVDVRVLMNAYMDEINNEKAEIENLKREKDSLYRDKFATIEGKIQADIAVLSEKILEKQSKITQLKERVLELPDKVDELNRLQREMDKLKNEGRSALDRTKKKADEFITNILDSKAEIEGRITEVDGLVAEQSDKIKEFEEINFSLDSKADKLRNVIDNAKAQVDELNAAMGALTEDLTRVEQTKSDISAMTDSIKTGVADRGEELRALEAELDGIAKMEHWVQEYVRDYEHKVDEIEDYVSRSEDELDELKSAAESLYMREYVSQLEEMTEDYQRALYDTVSKEQDIDTKISSSKARITELVKESQDVIRKVKGEPSADYGRLLTRIKERTGKIKSLVSEKQGERGKLREDSQSTRKTSSKVMPKVSKPVPKKKRK